MPDLPLSSKYRTNAGDPVADGERADLADRLAAEFTVGRLSQDDYLARLDLVYRAERLGELAGVVEALPPKSTYNVPAIAAQSGVPGEVNEAAGAPSKVVLAAGGVGVLALIGATILALMMLL